MSTPRPIQEMEAKWQQRWEKEGIYHAHAAPQREDNFYALVEFPFPSGDGLHVGHVRSYVALDVFSRKQRMLGKRVLYPMGWDAFGLPTENFAIKNKVKPSDATRHNVANYKRQLQSLGTGFDWSREVNTTDPAYFKWTQWQFLQFVKYGLAYKAASTINWCPKCKIGLANEEAQGNVCERCGNPVEKREKAQWMIKITKYAERLLKDLDLVDYWEKIKTQQRNWIGKSEGAEIDFPIEGTDAALRVFTTRPDTLFGVTYLVIAPEHALLSSMVSSEQRSAVEVYVAASARKTEIERGDAEREKTGVFTGAFATHPLTGEKVPIWTADYVLANYGTGAIMAVPAHDERDFAFAKKFELPIKRVVASSKGDEVLPYVEEGSVMNSGEFSGLSSEEARKTIVKQLEEKGVGEKATTYKLRDWVFSRQRYWGEPIPMVFCKTCAKTKQKVLLVHGYKGSSTKNFFPWMKEQLERAGFKVLAPDLPDASAPTVEDWTEALRPFVEQLGPQDVILAHSMGGKAIAHALEATGKKVGHTIFVGTSFGSVADRDWEKLAQLWPTMNVEAARAFWEAPLDWQKVSAQIVDKRLIVSDNDPLLNPNTLMEVPDGWFRIVEPQRGHFQGAIYPELLELVLSTKETGWVPLPETQLPLCLPDIEAYEANENGESPLAAIRSWVETTCPRCAGPAERETDTMPNWAGSSWYFLRYTDAHNTEQLASAEALRQWMPVDLYNGGMEHTTLHLLYSRFWHKFLWDFGAVPREIGPEPYRARRSHGLVLAAGGEKMSKSKGNVVNPDEITERYGADVLRVYELFMGPFDQPVPWDMNGIEGVRKFLDRVWQLGTNAAGPEVTPALETLHHQTLKKLSEGIEQLQFNTCVSQLMILTNAFQDHGGVPSSLRATYVQMIAPFAPHLAEELWSMQETGSVHLTRWPTFDANKLRSATYELVVQVAGKVRAKLVVSSDIEQEAAVALAMEDPSVQKWLQGNTPKQIVFVKGRLLNLVG